MPWVNNSFETESWPYMEAANYGPKRTRTRGAVIHSAETPEGENSAEGIGRWFASGNTVGSTHVGVDGGKSGHHTWQYVKDSYVCHGAPGANHDMVHIEQAGRASQSADDWIDPYSLRVIDRCANVVAQWALKYEFPLRHLSDSELRTGQEGIVDHAAVTRVYKRSDHWDPGPHYPWQIFMDDAKKWHKFWLSKSPGANNSPSEPDFRVVVIADSEVDAGVGRVFGAFNQLKFLRWPIHEVTVGHAVLIGAAKNLESKLNSWGVGTTVLSGATRSETAAIVANEIRRGYRKLPLPY